MMIKVKDMPLAVRVVFMVFFSIAIIGWIISLINQSAPVSDNPTQKSIYGDGWGITGIRSTRSSHISHIKATDQYIFFAYSQDNWVDAYSYDGAFQFSILTRDSQNGLVSIWCTDDLLYLKPKSGDILVFNGTEFIESITNDELKARGVRNSERNTVTVDREYVYSIDEAGKTHILFSTPEEIQRTWPVIKFGTYDDRIYSTVNLVGFLSIWLGLFIYVRRKSQKEKFPNLY